MNRWQPDRTVAVARQRKVRTPQSSVPDNVREGGPFLRSLQEWVDSTESATENIPPGPQGSGKGEKVR
jgi:hypothetical protein